MNPLYFQHPLARIRRRPSARWIATRFPQHRPLRATATTSPSAPAHPQKVTASTFEKAVIEASFERPVVVDFSTEGSVPCRFARSTLQEVAAVRFETALFATVDVDADPRLAERYGIHTVPTLHFFRDGQVVGSLVGLHGRDQIVRRLDAETPALLSA